jgi:hypothetical protein
MRTVPILILSFCLTAGLVRSEPSSLPPSRIKLNRAAFEFAIGLIQQGKFVSDSRTHWSADKPPAAAENEFIRLHGVQEYADWHLGIDESHREGTKARYKFPFGDFIVVHRCGLLAVRSRAHEYGYDEIAQAATRLETAMVAHRANQPRPLKTHR